MHPLPETRIQVYQLLPIIQRIPSCNFVGHLATQPNLSNKTDAFFRPLTH